jgi:cation transport regulator ChaB
MPTTKQDLPRTIQRSPAKAQRTYAKAHDNAVREYGEGERAHRTALAALKHSFEKVGDHWEQKKGKGPSDPRAASRARNGRTRGRSYGGVDVFGHSKRELYERARKLGVEGRSSMSKEELASAIARKQR